MFKSINAGFGVSKHGHHTGVSPLKPFIFNTQFVSTVRPVTTTLISEEDTYATNTFNTPLLLVTMSNNNTFYVDMDIDDFYTFIS